MGRPRYPLRANALAPKRSGIYFEFMNRIHSRWWVAVALLGIAGAAFFAAPSVQSARAATYVDARVLTFVGDPFPEPPGASEFCRQVYEGTHPDVTILLTLATREELVSAPIEDFYTVADGVGAVPIRACFDQDVSNDPEGVVSPLGVALALLSDRQWDAGGIGWAIAGYDNGCPPNWNGKTVDESRPGWWQGEQDAFQASLLAAIAANEPGLSLEEGSLRWWAPRVEVGPDVTSMNLPGWMRNLIIPYCDLSPEELAVARAGLDRPHPDSELAPEDGAALAECPPWNGRTVDESRPGWWQGEQDKFEASLLAAIATHEPGLSLEEGSLKRWAPRVAVGLDVTSMNLPAWMRNLIIPCKLSQEELVQPSFEPSPSPDVEPSFEPSPSPGA